VENLARRPRKRRVFFLFPPIDLQYPRVINTGTPTCLHWSGGRGSQIRGLVELSSATAAAVYIRWVRVEFCGGGHISLESLQTRINIPQERKLRNSWTMKPAWHTQPVRARRAIAVTNQQQDHLEEPLLSQRSRTSTGHPQSTRGRRVSSVIPSMDSWPYTKRLSDFSKYAFLLLESSLLFPWPILAITQDGQYLERVPHSVSNLAALESKWNLLVNMFIAPFV